MSWIFSGSCSGPWSDISSSGLSGFSQVQEWLAYILFSTCSQHSISVIIDLSFILASAVINVRLLRQNTHLYKKSNAGLGFIFTALFTALLSVAAIGITAFGVWEASVNHWTYDSVRETVFSAISAAAWITCGFVLLVEKHRNMSVHQMALRAWWLTSFVISVLQLLSSVFRLSAASGLNYSVQIEVFDMYILIRIPFTLFFLVQALQGTTSLHSVLQDSVLHQPLINNGVDGDTVTSGAAHEKPSAFANANLFSKLTFSWLNPLLNDGFKQSLSFADVPPLAPGDKAEHTFGMLQKTCSTSTMKRHALTIALLKTFWGPLLLTGFLQLLRTVVIYTGPMLISSFTNYANGERVSYYDGYALVFLLLIAKLIEVTCYHHFNFQSYKLGNNMRSAVITMIYRKSLRLSSSSRQRHGIGQITNYMAVDVQQISDSCLQLHLVWCIPVQVILALVLLWQDIGIASLAGIAIMVLVAVRTVYNARSQRSQMTNVTTLRDKRMRSITEVLAYMKVIKLEAWELIFQERIEAHRKKELSALTKFVILTAENMFALWNTISFVSTFTFVTAVLLDTGLTTAKVFTATSIFRVVQEPIRNFPQAIMTLSQLAISLERLNNFLLSSELDTAAITKCLEIRDEPIIVEKGFFGWDDAQEIPFLRNINLKIQRGSFVTIVGTVGCGKSSLLAALLGEMVKISGTVSTAGTFAYVPQSAWIQNATIMDNILFGAELNPLWYEKVIQACGLRLDLDSMDHGDQTEIGEKGINLSGGQKQRIQLARAIYQDCDVYLLDDIFSAVDAHTGSHLFKECILGLLKGKTVILVTHQVEFLRGADLVLVMREGTIVQSGKYEDILDAGTDFAALITAHKESLSLVDGSEKRLSNSGSGKSLHREHSQKLTSEISLESSSSRRSQSLKSADQLPISDSFSESRMVEASSKLIEEEQKEKGHVSWSVYWLYLTKAFGWGTVAVLLFNQSSWQALLLASDYWLAGEIPEDPSEAINKTKFITVYVLLNLAAWIAVVVRVVVVAAFGLKTAQLFFLSMLRSVLHAPMSFFDTTPSGRILSRFSSDQTNLDFLLHFFIGGCLSSYISAVGTIVVICISSWPIVFLVIPLMWLFYRYQNFYITSSREITRLDSISKAPLIYHFSETVAGVETIRCFRKQDSFIRENLIRTNTNMKMDFHNNTANEWLGIRLESMGTALLCATAFLIVALPSSIVKPDTVGLALSYALSLNAGLFWTVWLTCTIENKMVSVERIHQFTMIPSEAAFTISDCLLPRHWPDNGKIESIRLKLRYRPSTPLVLKGATFTIQGGEKVGIVGRTGSGKSTLLLAIFRLVEPCGGQLLIDGIDITTLGLHDLRSKLGIIPQDPILFEGTVRNNLDPLGIHNDNEIWKALDECQLAQAIRAKPEKLESSVTESGSNWSVGQRQLFCFGRALLKHGRILFLDEATASVDAQTDTIIQNIIRREFKNSTVMSIAHRIPTVMDSDKVLVMDGGRVKEFDSPASLLFNSRSVFSSLVHEYSARATQGQ
ncbi:hypothetical protein KP509_17G027900 [Ceratopteris richardii]|uniref:Uncharacterized protein n=1 Tax=Ceratopteris richardii TaxID=49495 RepID=A0A8T2ST03_CERRI|nr:hypothetical protein KP509_17G027900 [Ceratopteris richardii]